MNERYIVVEVHGYSINPNGRSSSQPATSYSILDTAYCHKEIAQFYASKRNPSSQLRGERAHTLCEHLNAEEWAWNHRNAA